MILSGSEFGSSGVKLRGSAALADMLDARRYLSLGGLGIVSWMSHAITRPVVSSVSECGDCDCDCD